MIRLMVRWTAKLRSRTLSLGPQGQIPCQGIAQALDLVQERRVYLRSASFPFPRLGELIEGAMENCILGKYRCDFFPTGSVFFVGKVEDSARARFVIFPGFEMAVVDGKLGKVGEDRERQFGAPGIAAQLVSGTGIVFDADRGLFRFEEELLCPAYAEGVVRRLGGAPHFDGSLVDYVLVGFCNGGLVSDIPAEGFKEGVDKFHPHLGLTILRVVGIEVLVELCDQLSYLLWHLSHEV